MKSKTLTAKTERSLLLPCLFAVLLVAVLIFCAPRAEAASIVASGDCGANGSNVRWSLDSDGVLTISGKGEMADYDWENNRSPWRKNKNILKTVVIQKGVTTIGQYAFQNCEKMESVSIPSSVTEVKWAAFAGCRKLTSVTVPNGVTTIGDDAFFGCYRLTTVVFPNSLKTIGDSAFFQCGKLKTMSIPDGVTYIGDFSFYCDGLTSVSISKNVEYIGSGAFGNCKGLTKIEVSSENEDYSSDAFGCLYDKEKTCFYQYPVGNKRTSFTVPNGVEYIDYGAFEACISLTSVAIANSVKWINERAFLGCTGLKSINIPNGITVLDEDVFHSCTGLTSVTIPNSVETIGVQAFFGCKNLTSLTIPNSVKTIKRWAFGDCEKLKSVVIPDGVTEIANELFEGCNGLTSVTIPGSVTEIGEYAFCYCNNLKSLIIPDRVKTIGVEAFNGCGSLKSISIPKSVTSIDEEAFSHCKNLKTVEIFNPKCKIGKEVFGDSPVTIYGYKDSTAQAYAKSNGLPFSVIHNHIYNVMIEPATCQQTGYQYQVCKLCGERGNEKTLPKLAHSYQSKMIAATTEKNGKTYGQCTICGAVKKYSTIPRIATVELEKTSYTYDGTRKTPALTVKDSKGKTLKKNTDYKVKYAAGRTDCGVYKVVVKFMGNYSGKQTLTFQIVPVKVTGLKQTKGSGIRLAWNETGGATYYEIYYVDKNTSTYRPLNDKHGNPVQKQGTTLKNTNISAGTVMKFKVRAVVVSADGSVVKGPFSKVLTATAR